jgi:thiazole synthase
MTTPAPWQVAGATLTSRLFLGTALFGSPEQLRQAVRASESGVVTVSLRRLAPQDRAGAGFWDLIRELGVRVLPNTAGCRTVKEAVTTAHMAREVFGTTWLKLEVIGDDYTLQPDTAALIEAARILAADGFDVFPYTTDDLIVAQRLLSVGCRVVMPWGSPIGSGQGLLNRFALTTMRQRLPEATLIVDAGIGKPSDAAQALELGFDAVLVNSAVALARDPVQMAGAFRDAVRAGRAGYEAGIMTPRNLAHASTPTLGTPFWHQAPPAK